MGTTYISNRELEELGDALVRHYLDKVHIQDAPKCIDIEGLAGFLGLHVVFESFAEEDIDKIGFLSDGETSLKVRRNGDVVPFCFPKGTIVLDTLLSQEWETGRRRFTIAHEVAHHVLDRHNTAPQFHRAYDPEHGYTLQELKAHMNMAENQADRLAAVILMPPFTLEQALQDYNNGQKIRVYGQSVYAGEERMIIDQMASRMGVSFTAMQIRLRELGLLEHRPLDEYVENTLLGAGGTPQTELECRTRTASSRSQKYAHSSQTR